ncbi:hypothetical protein B5F77_13810, partial [Parabacteroides sp. An277]
RVCDVNSGVQEASSPADAALNFWFFSFKRKEQKQLLVKKFVAAGLVSLRPAAMHRSPLRGLFYYLYRASKRRNFR